MIHYADRVFETSTSQGTGDVNLDGAVAGYQTFIEGTANAAKVPYAMFDDTNWEIGRGTVEAGSPDKLKRDVIIASSNGDNAVNWGPGTRSVILPNSNHFALWRDENLCFVGNYAGAASGTANAQTITLSPAPIALSNGALVSWRSVGNTTGSVTLNINGLGAKTLKWFGANLANGAYQTGDLVEGVYNQSADCIDLKTPPRYLSLKAKGSSIASAATTDIGAADSQFVSVTGTTTITSLGSTAAQNHVWVQFDGIVTLTHHATSLILPTGANITTAAGDVAEFVRVSGSNWKCVGYQRADGTPLANTGGIRLQSSVATTSGTAIDFTGIPAGVRRVNLMLDQVQWNASLLGLIQLGDSGGVENTGYYAGGGYVQNSNVAGVLVSSAGFHMTGTFNAGNAVSGKVSFELMDAANNTWVASGCLYHLNTPIMLAGSKSLSAVLDRIRLTTTTGTPVFNGGKAAISWEF